MANEDVYITYVVCCRWLASVWDVTPSLCSRLDEFKCPVFVLHGTDDKLCEPAGAQMLYDNAASQNKQIKVPTHTKRHRR